MARITAPPTQWQRSCSKKTDASWEEETEDSHEINDTAFDTSTPAPEKPSCSVLLTVSDVELDEVTLVSDSRFDGEEKLDALMRNLIDSVTSSEVAPAELVTVESDCNIDYKWVQWGTTRTRRPSRRHRVQNALRVVRCIALAVSARL